MADTFNVTAAYDKTSYNAGDKITVTISGNASNTTTTTGTVGALTIPIVAADGSTTTINAPSEAVTVTTTTPETVKIDTTKTITDASGRTWTVAADGMSMTATA